MTDEHSPMYSSTYGHPLVQTPFMDQLAQEGATFDNAYCNSPLCLPSRMSFMTGRYINQIGAYDNASPLPSDTVTWAHMLRAVGYDVTLSGKQHFCGPDQLHGFNKQLARDLHAELWTKNGMLRGTADWSKGTPAAAKPLGGVADAGPGTPVVILGLGGVPTAGDDVIVVDSERRAREVAAYRQAQMREVRTAARARGSLEQMFTDIAEGKTDSLPVVIKADVQGSLEAIVGSPDKLATDEVAINLLQGGVGGSNESDITLAQASNAAVIGFNIRANAQARKLAQRDNVEIRYYSVIYDLIDDLKASLSGMLAPTLRERILGNAQVLEVFDISKIGNIAGCRVTDGLIKRTSSVRLLRDETVIYEGKLAALKRFKDDAREVKDGLECGIAFENYHDIREGDIIEAYEVEEFARSL